MPWQESSIMDQRIRFVVLASRPDANMTRLCDEFGISRPTGYLWLQRYEVGGFRALADGSHRPHSSPKRTSADLEERVLVLRHEYGWGAKKIARLLEPNVRLPVSTINRILKRRGEVADRDSHPPACQRFEREHPNELWQVDFKGQFRCRCGWCYPLSVLDDHSRFALDLGALSDMSGDFVWGRLVPVLCTYGLPDSMLMDHGEPWWGGANPYGLTALAVRLLKQGIRLLHGAVAHPQTQGKVERFHRTLDEAMRRERPLPDNVEGWAERFAAFRSIYNTVRPHEALGLATPDSRYQPSQRAYVAEPAEWVYPADLMVHTVDRLGMISDHGKRYFISEALMGEAVGVESVGTRRLVCYRDLYIRDVDLAKGTTMPLHCYITSDRSQATV